jgi:ankyrin repeat protein
MQYGYFYALKWAATKGKTSTAGRVFEYRDGMAIPMTWLQIALGRAITNCSWGIVRLLVINGADVNTRVKGLGCVLQAASWKGDTSLVQLLLDAGAEVNAQNGHYGSALAAAAWCGHIAVTELLISKGADINADGGHYGNALQAASWAGHQSIVDYFIKNGASVYKTGGFYGGALQAACWIGNEQVVKLLLQAGSDTTQSHDFKSALEVAYNRGHISIFRIISTWTIADVLGVGSI